MSVVNSSVQKLSRPFAKKLAAYAIQKNLANASAFQVSVPTAPVYNNFSDAMDLIEYEPLPTYVTPRDWTSLFARVSKYQLRCSETPDYTKIVDISHAQNATPRYKARLDVNLNSIKVTRAEREILKRLVGNRFDAEKNTICFVSRDLPSMMANENRVCQLLELTIAKAQQLAWLMSHADPSKSTFIPEQQFANLKHAQVLTTKLYNNAAHEAAKLASTYERQINYIFDPTRESQQSDTKDRFRAVFGKHINAIKQAPTE